MQGNVSASIAKIVGQGPILWPLGGTAYLRALGGMVHNQLIIINYSSRHLQF